MAELDDVKKTECKISLGGKDRELRFHFRAWAALEEEFHGIDNIVDALNKAQFATIASLLFVGIKREDGEDITKENVLEWLDEYDLAGILDIVKSVTSCLFASMPNAKKGTRQTAAPQDAK